MASVAEIEANRLNAAASSGPKTPDGKPRSFPNHLKFGLYSTQNCVRPEETAEYTKLYKALWNDLNPVGPVEQMLAVRNRVRRLAPPPLRRCRSRAWR